jgi:type I restriction enzyme S subunit
MPDPSIEVQVGDLLFTRKNTYELVAAAALVWETPPRLLMSDLIFRLRLHPDAQMDSCFLHHLLTCPSKRREILASGAAASMPNISKARLGSVLVEVPPLELQRKFARHVAAAMRLKTSHRISSQEAEQLFASLQQRAFTGALSS